MQSTLGYKKPKQGEWILRQGWIWPERPCVKGHNAPRNRASHCMQCVRDYRKSKGHFRNETDRKWRAANRVRNNENRREWVLRNPKQYLVNICRAVAKRKGVPFDLETSDFEIPDICPVLGIVLKRGLGARTDASPSIDRIVPENGYVRGNVIVISWRANRIKNDASIAELRRVADFYQLLSIKD